MNAAMPYLTSREHDTEFDTLRFPAYRKRSRFTWRVFTHPLTVICVAQAVLSLCLIRSNTAYIDEADYLWVGRLELAHWLHDTSWPSLYAERIFSGSPLIYPPLGAFADSVGGLIGARILSLVFMLGATVLLYFTAFRLIGRRGAVVSLTLWAFSEPAIRLAFATFDALSVLLTAVAAWLILQTCYRRYNGVFVFAAAASLAIANATAYSGIAIDPIVIAFAFLIWLPYMGVRRAALYTMWLIGAAAIFLGMLIAVSHSLSGLMFTIIARNVADHQGFAPILSDICKYAGIIMALATIGSIVALNSEKWPRSVMLVLLGCAVFIVPAAQLRDQTAWSLDKHVAYGIWFASITAGYGFSRLVRWLPRGGRIATACCLIAAAYIGVNSWQSAWNRYHSWPDSNPFISAFRAVAPQSKGLIYVPGKEANIAEYYTPEGKDWTRWSASPSLNPVAIPPSAWNSYYRAQLHRGDYGLVALFYGTTFSSAPDLPGKVILRPPGDSANEKLLSLVGDDPAEPGLSALTQALQDDPDYNFIGIGPYDSASTNGIYAIWQRKPQK
jgi:hypothetical protein